VKNGFEYTDNKRESKKHYGRVENYDKSCCTLLTVNSCSFL